MGLGHEQELLSKKLQWGVNRFMKLLMVDVEELFITTTWWPGYRWHEALDFWYYFFKMQIPEFTVVNRARWSSDVAAEEVFRNPSTAHSAQQWPAVNTGQQKCRFPAVPSHLTILDYICLIHKTCRNRLHLSSADCGQTNRPVCTQIASPAGINHNYRVGLAHRSCINIPYSPLLVTSPVPLGGDGATAWRSA